MKQSEILAKPQKKYMRHITYEEFQERKRKYRGHPGTYVLHDYKHPSHNDMLATGLIYENRRLNANLMRLLGVSHEANAASPLDCTKLCVCPFCQEINKYMPSVGRKVRLLVPCGKCMYCRHKSQNALIFRIINHNQMYKNCIFTTLTYNDEHYTDSPEVARQDITKFLKRFRKELDDNTFSYYMVCERGDERNRIHFHLLIWYNGSLSKEFIAQMIRMKWRDKQRNFKTLSEVAKLQYYYPSTPIGFVKNDLDATSNVIAYVTKYVSETGKKLLFRSWSLGLGRDILSLDDDLLQKLRYLNVIAYDNKTGKGSDSIYHVTVPQYYKNQIFTIAERDVMFQDYLVSDAYKYKADFFNDYEKVKMLVEVYEDYEKRTLAAYKARKQSKKRKNVSYKNSDVI